MGVEWFYRHNGRIYGPLSSGDLEAALMLGFISPNDLVCKRETNAWKEANNVPELRHAIPGKPSHMGGDAVFRSKQEPS